MTTATIMDDDPITLREACEIVFRGNVSVSTLRAEAARGRLTTFRVGRRYFTTIGNVRELMRKGGEDEAAPAMPSSVQTVPFDLVPEADVVSLHETLRERLAMLKPAG